MINIQLFKYEFLLLLGGEDLGLPFALDVKGGE